MASKNPTNSDIMKKLDSMDGRLIVVENWRRETEIAKKAVEEYQAEQDRKQKAKLETKKTKETTELIKQIGVVVAIIIAILYAWAATNGIKLN